MVDSRSECYPEPAPAPPGPAIDFALLRTGLRALTEAYAGQAPAADMSAVSLLGAPFLETETAKLNPFTRNHAAPIVREWRQAAEPIPSDLFQAKLKFLSVSLDLPGAADAQHMKGVDLLWLLGALAERALDSDDPLRLNGPAREAIGDMYGMLAAQESWLAPESDRAVEMLHAVLESHDLAPGGLLHPQLAALVEGVKTLERRGVFTALARYETEPLPPEAIEAWRPRMRYAGLPPSGVPYERIAEMPDAPAVAHLRHLRDDILPALTGQPDWAAVAALPVPHPAHHFIEDHAPPRILYGDARLAERHGFVPSLHRTLPDGADAQSLFCLAQVAQTLAVATPCVTQAGRLDPDAQAERAALLSVSELARTLAGLAPQSDQGALSPRTHAELATWGHDVRFAGKQAERGI